MALHNYTAEQRSIMASKLAAMKDGHRFMLNEKDHGLEVLVRKRKNSVQVLSCKTHRVIASSTTVTGLVGEIIEALQNWDGVLLQEVLCRKN